MDTFYSIVEAFARVSDLLHINLEALFLSLDSFGVLFFHFSSAAGYMKVGEGRRCKNGE